MSKRSAANELNHDNWCEEDEPEAAGVFQRANADTLKDRKIRTARRRGVAHSGNDATDSGEQGGTKSIFAGFSGFKKTEPASAKAVFSFLAATPNGSASKTESGGTVSATELTTMDKKVVNGVDSASDSTLKSNEFSDYYRRLKGLNESVAKWISTHVSNNPLIILTPIFRDYEKHLASIQGKDDSKTIGGITSFEGCKQADEKKDSISQFSNSSNSDKADSKPAEEKKALLGGSIFGSTSNSASAATATFSFGSTGSATSSTSPGQTGFCFGSPPATNPSATTFSFGSTTSSPSAGFSFGAGKPFTFSNVASNTTEEKKEADNEDDDEDSPPKPDHKPVNEDGATYTKRCKIFIKKDKEYSDRGIGNLFLKPVDGGKMQLIVRADTSLGNVLLNILIGSTLPIQRIGTNNVAVVCLPTPESQPPPVTVLIRVKTKDDADELFNTLEKHKKEAA
ncbi:hypothetical protein ONE63_004059 [Megalurothrips usitatus]|uniref:RanBD1 domain-containing protein n=1 Tax=Megalurothrips usitatus TaxID=439358 RepID=A0AAV7X981_9NEOP|nr:hypothetical protein ONE63_004059 [Megalurothrips usitatus]